MFFILFVIYFNSRNHTRAHANVEAMAHYIPPINYGMVEEDLYRSGQPNVLNFPFLERLNLKTIIWLAPDDPTQQLYPLPFPPSLLHRRCPALLTRGTQL
jgi:hypothetical protein